MPPFKISCFKCKKNITNKDCLKCSLCNCVYDITCVNETERQLKLDITKTKSPRKNPWICPDCRNTSVSSKHSTLYDKNLDLTPSVQNVTLRTREAPNNNVTNNSCSKFAFSVDPALLLAVENAVDRAVKKSLEREFQQMREELAILGEFKKTIDLISEDYDCIKSKLEETTLQISHLTRENNRLSRNVNDLSSRLNLMEQHSRENNLEINGIPEGSNENILTIVKQLSSVVSCPLQDSDIMGFTRVRKLNDQSKKPRAMIIKLRSTRIRDDVIAAVSKFNRVNKNDKLHSGHLGFGGNNSAVFVSEHLSPYYKSLHAETRKMARDKGIQYVWVRNGRIFTRANEKSPAKLIKSFECLKLF